MTFIVDWLHTNLNWFSVINTLLLTLNSTTLSQIFIVWLSSFDIPIVVAMLDITFVVVDRYLCTPPSFFRHFCRSKNDVKQPSRFGEPTQLRHSSNFFF
uniref:Putative ovule protein n=1 Tax=Solanum chacoense TaxID=4108 RepID=A0A0V0I022_SOLCH